MSVQRLEQSHTHLIQSYPLSTLRGAVVGVDATHYLTQILSLPIEPLKTALSGIPFTLQSRIEEDIRLAQENDVTLIFVFDGLTYTNKLNAASDSIESRKAHEDGWNRYENGDASVVDDFGRAKYPIDLITPVTQKLLYHHGIQYLVAPFSAVATLASLYNTEEGQPIDAILSSTDVFLFGVDKVILSLDSKGHSYTWMKKSDIEDLVVRPGVTPEMFRSAQLMLGSSFLPAFPLLFQRPIATIEHARDLLLEAPLLQLCQRHKNDPRIASLSYAERYKKALMTIQHHIVMITDGSVQPLDFEHAPGDVHAFVGNRLPDEIFFYMSRGLIGPTVSDWCISREVLVTLPGGAIDCEPFRRLVVDQLNPVRLQAIKLYCETLTFWYHNKSVTFRSYDGKSKEESLKPLSGVKDSPSWRWRINESMLPWDDREQDENSSMLSCLVMLQNKDFAAKTIFRNASASNVFPRLTARDEIISNMYWSLLQHRGYVDDKHELTVWGRMLEAALSSSTLKNQHDVFLAVEMLRYGAFTTQTVRGEYIPVHEAGSENRMYTNLLSKIACLGRLKHQAMGWIGPLDRRLLTFAWEVSAVRQVFRVLSETIVTTMFIRGDANKIRDDWYELADSIPFAEDKGASLGIVVRSYLDGLDTHSDKGEDVAVLKEKLKSQEKPYKWFASAEGGNIRESLNEAWALVDAVFAAVKVGKKEVKNATDFEKAEKWLADKR